MAEDKKRQGFGSMTPERRKEVSTSGGKAARNRHKFTSEQATEAGRKGGKRAYQLHGSPRVRGKQEKETK
jgi:uncharacterized protein